MTEKRRDRHPLRLRPESLARRSPAASAYPTCLPRAGRGSSTRGRPKSPRVELQSRAALRCRSGVRPDVLRPPVIVLRGRFSAASISSAPRRPGRRRRPDVEVDAGAGRRARRMCRGGLNVCSQMASPFVAPATGIDAGAFRALDVAAKMALLNIEAKLRETVHRRRAAHLVCARPAARRRRSGVSAFRFRAQGADASRHRYHRSDRHTSPGTWPVCPRIPTAGNTRGLPKGTCNCRSRGTQSVAGRRSASLVHSADVDINLGRGLAHAQGMAREQRVPARPQDQSGAGLRAALRAGDPAALCPGSGG